MYKLLRISKKPHFLRSVTPSIYSSLRYQSTTTNLQLPSDSSIVIVGGGIIGCSTAYHLAQLGCTDVTLIEKHALTSGSTFHAAGLVGVLRSNANITQLLRDSVDLYDRLEKEEGCGWKRNGGLRIACSQERMIELKRLATMAKSFGLDMQILTPSQAKDLWPLMDISDVVGAVYLSEDGQANPSDITQALAKGARKKGIKIFENCSVEKIDVENKKVVGIQTSRGYIKCKILVNTGGFWAKEIGKLAGVNIPLQAIKHQYMITEKIDGISGNLPTMRDNDNLLYFKEEVGGLVIGGYERNPKIVPWGSKSAPNDFHFQLFDKDWDHFEPLMENACKRVPALSNTGVKDLICGPESFTPDGNFIMGLAPEVSNFYVAAGFNSYGIASAGGAGKALAEWIVNGQPSMDLWPVDIRRFHDFQRDEWVKERSLEIYAKHYSIVWPFEEFESVRGVRKSPFYERLKQQNAVFGSKLGWERVNWFSTKPNDEDSKTFGIPNWFNVVKEEVKATRERVSIQDSTSFGKFLVIGKDAPKAMEWLCTNRMDKPPGSTIYTQMLNKNGGIESDVTVSRLQKDKYYIITGTAFTTRDGDWMNRNIPPECTDVHILDITSQFAVLSIQGPDSRKLLQELTNDDMSNKGFPFSTHKYITFKNGCRALVIRITYVGELGYELHIPNEYALGIYDLIMHVGEKYKIKNIGYRAVESLRLEKGYRLWSADITPDYTPLEAGLSFTCKLKYDIPFLGREALIKQQKEGIKKKLSCFSIRQQDVKSIIGDYMLLGRETVYRNNQKVGYFTSIGFGHHVGMYVGYAYVNCEGEHITDYLKTGKYEIEVFSKRIPCTLHLTSLYDPKNERIKC